jgi:peptidoglycan/LPS O-acetylase OafA/YrhL
MKRIESLTFFRFVAAVIIVIFHFGGSTRLAQLGSPLIISGEQFVSFFFVLSGFVLMVAYYDRENENLWDFYISRLARIVPVYLIALAIVMFFRDFIPFTTTHRSLEFILNLTFLQAWFPPYPLTLNFPAWAVSVELFFYLVFPFILWAIKKSGVSWKYLAVMALFTYIFTQAILSNLLVAGFYKGNPSVSHDLIYFFPLVHFCSFFLGVSGGYLYVKNKEQFSRSGWMPSSVMLASLVINYLMLQHPGFLVRIIGIPLAFGSSFYSLPFLLLILGLAYADNIFTRFLSNPFFRLLGDSSYSIYIFQLPISILYFISLSRIVKNDPGWSSDIYFSIYIVLLILFSILSLYLVERPAKKWLLAVYHGMIFKKEPAEHRS